MNQPPANTETAAKAAHRITLAPGRAATVPAVPDLPVPELPRIALPAARPSANAPAKRFVVLGSGSAGNAAVVDRDGIRLMIDAGLSAKQLNLRLEAVGIPDSANGGLNPILRQVDSNTSMSVLLEPAVCQWPFARAALDISRQDKAPPASLSGWRRSVTWRDGARAD